MSKAGRTLRVESAFAIIWFAAVSNGISHFAKVSFWIVFPVVLVVVAFLGFLALAWLVRWARNRAARPGQFGIATLLLLIFYFAAFLGFVQWLVSELDTNDTATYLKALIGCYFLVLFSLAPALWFIELLLWSAVWLTRRLIRRNISDSLEEQPPAHQATNNGPPTTDI